MTTLIIPLPRPFDDREIGVTYYENIENPIEVHKYTRTPNDGSLGPHVYVRPELIAGPTHIAAAVCRALERERTGTAKSHSLAAEILSSLIPVHGISECLGIIGVDKPSRLIAIALADIGKGDEELKKCCKVIRGVNCVPLWGKKPEFDSAKFTELAKVIYPEKTWDLLAASVCAIKGL